MQPIKKFLEASFRIKILVPVILVMAALLAVTVGIVNQQFTHLTEDTARLELKAADMRMRNELVKHQKNLGLRLRSLANEPLYRAAFETLNPKTIRKSLTSLMQDEGLVDENVEFAFFTPAGGQPADGTDPMYYEHGNFHSPRLIRRECDPAVQRTLQNGALPDAPADASVDVVSLNDKLFQIISLPIFNASHEHFCGVLTFGEEINWKTAQEFSMGARGQTVLVAGPHIIASTFKALEQPTNLVEQFQSLRRQPGSTALQNLQVGGRNYYFTAGKFASIKDDNTIGYLLFSSYDAQLAVKTQTQQILLAVILVGIILGSAVVLFFISRATVPLRQLHAAAETVGRGDFSARVNIRSKDEFGELGHTFNQMTENIELSQSKLKQTVETLKTTQAQLIQSEKLSAVGEFVAGVAHELNNPLAAVMGFSEMLKSADVGEKHSRHLDIIFKSAQRCQKIVQSLLSFARRAAPERKPVSVNKLIEDVLEMISYPLRTSNVKVVTHFSQQMPVVLADGHQVQQVVLNIINNARQAIEGKTEAGCITLTTNHDANFVRIVIQDNGPGIAPENLKRIFDPFFTTKEVGKGTGLGLSLCYGMIREHGGNILATSSPGAGATFTIELPVADEAAWFETAFLAKTTTATNQPETREGAGKKVLVVDDEESLLQMIQEELTQHSYEVVTALNGEAALREAKRQKFDVIICDLKMPGLNGRQVYERLCVENREAARRMVFVTGDIIGEPLRNFLETEKRPCLNKPFSLGDLRQAVKEVLLRS